MAKIKNILIIILGLIVGALAVYSITLSHKIKTLLGQAPTVITDTVTLTDVQFDTIFICSYTRDTLAVVDTAFIYDTLTQTYYATVEVPISSYILDTSIVIHPYYSNFSDSLTVGIFERVRGYGVTIDTLTLDYNAIVTPIKPERKLKFVPAPALGVGVNLKGDLGVFLGLGIGVTIQ